MIRRLTEKIIGAWHMIGMECAGCGEMGVHEQVLERLARYEDYYEHLYRKRERIQNELRSLRAAGQKKTARFRDLIGKKMMIDKAISVVEFFID